jgi:hypothetical protein
MTTEVNRRDFLKKGALAGMAGCALLITARMNPLFANSLQPDETVKPDPKKLNYCGYQCPSDCKFLKATQENNTELKKEAYEIWKIKEKHNVDFDPEKIFCWGCKTSDKPEGVVVKGCQVRKCTIEKGYDCCIECSNLTACNFDLWKQFPDFHTNMINKQKRFLSEK